MVLPVVQEGGSEQTFFGILDSMIKTIESTIEKKIHKMLQKNFAKYWMEIKVFITLRRR